MAGVAALLAIASTLRAATITEGERPSSRALLFADLALVGPLTLHLGVQAHRWAPVHLSRSAGACFDDAACAFTGWVQASLFLAGPSHLVFAALCAWRGMRADGEMPNLALVGGLTSATTLWCCVPFGGYGLLPAVYVAVTCVPLLLLMRRLERR